MTKVNITPATKKIAEAAEMYVEFDVCVQEMGDDSVSFDSIVIGDENSDFYIEYIVCNDGTLNHYTSPSYVDGLPKWIETSAQLKSVVKYAVERCQAA